MNRDAVDALQSFETIRLRCFVNVRGDACLKEGEKCTGACHYEQQARAPKAPSPFSCSPMTDEQRDQVHAEAEEARAEEIDREHFHQHPEQYR